MLVLLGIGVVVLGFVLRANPLLVVMAAALTTGLAAAWTSEADLQTMYVAGVATLSAFGKAFNDNRYVSVVWVVLMAIGLLERAGLQERARAAIAKVKAATVGRLLWVYLIIRQGAAAVGLTSLGGHPQMVRPLVAPMAEGAATAKYGELPDRERFLIRSHAAAVDNIGVDKWECTICRFPCSQEIISDKVLGGTCTQITFTKWLRNVEPTIVTISIWHFPHPFSF